MTFIRNAHDQKIGKPNNLTKSLKPIHDIRFISIAELKLLVACLTHMKIIMERTGRCYYTNFINIKSNYYDLRIIVCINVTFSR